MKQLKIYILLSSLIGLSLCSCSDWLDVEPKDMALEDKMFESKKGINSVLNGLYQSMTKENLYGGQMSTTTIEFLAQYYIYPLNLSAGHNLETYYYLGNYNYDQKSVQEKFEPIWKETYSIIYRINTYIDNVQKSDKMSQEIKDVMLGEAYGLRAFLHLDMLRLFGPVYKTDPTALAIPYNDMPKVSTYPKSTAQEVMDKILKDITTAENLLKNDPILTHGVKYIEDETEHNKLSSEDIFNNYYRNRRMNFFAVKALKARALLYKGDIAGAGQEASYVIENSKTAENKSIFPFYGEANIYNENNYIMQSEVIFAIENIDMYTRWNDYTNGTLYYKTYMAEGNNLINNIFGYNRAEDHRVRQWVASKVIGGNFYVSRKYEDYGYETYNTIKNVQPLMRISEMYYIRAEAKAEANNMAAALEDIKTVRRERGWQDGSQAKPETTDKDEFYKILESEYYKEFYGEGQAFFFHKRLNNRYIYNGSNGGTLDLQSFDKNPYLIPLPKNETDV